MPGNPVDAVDGYAECQFGAGTQIGVDIPGLNEPGAAGIIYACLESFLQGVLWQIELAAKIATGIPAVILDFLPATPEDFVFDVFLDPYLDNIPQPIPATTLDLGGVVSIPIPEVDNNGLFISAPELYGPGTSWYYEVTTFLKLVAILLAIPFLVFWEMVTSVISDPLTLPPLPTVGGIQTIFNDLALSAGINTPSVGTMGGCLAEACIALL